MEGWVSPGMDALGIALFGIGCLSIVVAYLFQKHVINKGIARGGPRIMLPMGVMGALLAVVGLVLVIRGLL